MKKRYIIISLLIALIALTSCNDQPKRGIFATIANSTPSSNIKIIGYAGTVGDKAYFVTNSGVSSFDAETKTYTAQEVTSDGPVADAYVNGTRLAWFSNQTDPRKTSVIHIKDAEDITLPEGHIAQRFLEDGQLLTKKGNALYILTGDNFETETKLPEVDTNIGSAVSISNTVYYSVIRGTDKKTVEVYKLGTGKLDAMTAQIAAASENYILTCDGKLFDLDGTLKGEFKTTYTRDSILIEVGTAVIAAGENGFHNSLRVIDTTVADYAPKQISEGYAADIRSISNFTHVQKTADSYIIYTPEKGIYEIKIKDALKGEGSSADIRIS